MKEGRPRPMKVKFLRFSLFPILITEGPPQLRSSSWRPLENQPDPLHPSLPSFPDLEVGVGEGYIQ